MVVAAPSVVLVACVSVRLSGSCSSFFVRVVVRVVVLVLRVAVRVVVRVVAVKDKNKKGKRKKDKSVTLGVFLWAGWCTFASSSTSERISPTSHTLSPCFPSHPISFITTRCTSTGVLVVKGVRCHAHLFCVFCREADTTNTAHIIESRA